MPRLRNGIAWQPELVGQHLTRESTFATVRIDASVADGMIAIEQPCQGVMGFADLDVG